jgi:hypothetical protein
MCMDLSHPSRNPPWNFRLLRLLEVTVSRRCMPLSTFHREIIVSIPWSQRPVLARLLRGRKPHSVPNTDFLESEQPLRPTLIFLTQLSLSNDLPLSAAVVHTSDTSQPLQIVLRPRRKLVKVWLSTDVIESDPVEQLPLLFFSLRLNVEREHLVEDTANFDSDVVSCRRCRLDSCGAVLPALAEQACDLDKMASELPRISHVKTALGHVNVHEAKAGGVCPHQPPLFALVDRITHVA